MNDFVMDAQRSFEIGTKQLSALYASNVFGRQRYRFLSILHPKLVLNAVVLPTRCWFARQ